MFASLVLILLATAHAQGLVCRQGYIYHIVSMGDLGLATIANATACPSSLASPSCLAINGSGVHDLGGMAGSVGINLELFMCVESATCPSTTCNSSLTAHQKKFPGALSGITISSCQPVKCCATDKCNDVTASATNPPPVTTISVSATTPKVTTTSSAAKMSLSCAIFTLSYLTLKIFE